VRFKEREKMKNPYPGLAHLCGAYLHQDYMLSGGTLEDAIRAFIENRPEPTLLAASSDIDRLIETAKTDAEVWKILEASGLEVDVARHGWSLRPWMAWIREGICKELNRRAADGGLPPEEWEDNE
jgi:CdiI immunity protein